MFLLLQVVWYLVLLGAVVGVFFIILRSRSQTRWKVLLAIAAIWVLCSLYFSRVANIILGFVVVKIENRSGKVVRDITIEGMDGKGGPVRLGALAPGKDTAFTSYRWGRDRYLVVRYSVEGGADNGIARCSMGIGDRVWRIAPDGSASTWPP